MKQARPPDVEEMTHDEKELGRSPILDEKELGREGLRTQRIFRMPGTGTMSELFSKHGLTIAL